MASQITHLPFDPLVQRVVGRIVKRSMDGMIKFGVSMEAADKTTIQWLRDAQEEALDTAVYLERVITDLERTQGERINRKTSV